MSHLLAGKFMCPMVVFRIAITGAAGTFLRPLAHHNRMTVRSITIGGKGNPDDSLILVLA